MCAKENMSIAAESENLYNYRLYNRICTPFILLSLICVYVSRTLCSTVHMRGFSRFL